MTSKQLSILRNIIGGVETGGQQYGKQRYNAFTNPKTNTPSEHYNTFGAWQFYGTEGTQLLRMIRSANQSYFTKMDTYGIGKDLDSANFVAYSIDQKTAKAKCIIQLISSSAGIQCQNQMIDECLKGYLKRAEEFGVTAVGSQMMWCECQHLGGLKPVKRIFSRTAKPYSVDAIFASLMLDQQDQSNSNQIGDKTFQSRHKCCTKWIKQYVDDENDGNTKPADKNEWVKQLQAVIGAQVDGIPGRETLSKCPTLHVGSTGTTVKLLQIYLGDHCAILVAGGYDGILGSGSKAAIMKYQRLKGLVIDGIVGKNTWKMILGL